MTPRRISPKTQERERKILEFLANGYTYVQIAEIEHVGYDAIKISALRLFERLGAETQAHAVAIAYHRRILRLPD